MSGGSKSTSAKDDRGSVAITCPYDAFSQATYPQVWGGGVLRVTYFLYLVKNHVTLLPDCITPAWHFPLGH